jgi:hypothetical protein
MNVLSDNTLRATENGLDLLIRLPWYRSLPLSTVEIRQVRIDGKAVDADKISLAVNGKNFKLDQFAELTGEYWFVLDSAILNIEYPGAKPGAEYDVEVVVVLYPPYIAGISFPNLGTSRLRAG